VLRTECRGTGLFRLESVGRRMHSVTIEDAQALPLLAPSS